MRETHPSKHVIDSLVLLAPSPPRLAGWDRDSSVRPTFEGLVRQLTDMTMSPDSFINPVSGSMHSKHAGTRCGYAQYMDGQV